MNTINPPIINSADVAKIAQTASSDQKGYPKSIRKLEQCLFIDECRIPRQEVMRVLQFQLVRLGIAYNRSAMALPVTLVDSEALNRQALHPEMLAMALSWRLRFKPDNTATHEEQVNPCAYLARAFGNDASVAGNVNKASPKFTKIMCVLATLEHMIGLEPDVLADYINLDIMGEMAAHYATIGRTEVPRRGSSFRALMAQALKAGLSKGPNAVLHLEKFTPRAVDPCALQPKVEEPTPVVEFHSEPMVAAAPACLAPPCLAPKANQLLSVIDAAISELVQLDDYVQILATLDMVAARATSAKEHLDSLLKIKELRNSLPVALRHLVK